MMNGIDPPSAAGGPTTKTSVIGTGGDSAAATATAPLAVGQLNRGIVKQALSGDVLVVRGQPKGGPPPERVIVLSNVVAPKLARRPGNDPSMHDSKDEPFAWEAREFLRQKLTGKEVFFTSDVKMPSGREAGTVYLGHERENIVELMVSEGLVEVKNINRPNDEQLQRLNALQASAKAAGKGKWVAEEKLAGHVRDITWLVDDPRFLVDSLKQVPQKAVIEHIRDGSTVRAFLLPDFKYITLMMSGIKCPIIRTGEGGQVVEAEPFGEEARFFIESRLLQRDVEIVLESVANQNFVGTVIHPNGNIAELLLKEGFAKCVRWNIAMSAAGPEKLMAAEAFAKEKRLRIWRTYDPVSAPERGSFQAKVAEVVLGDCLMVQKESGEVAKIFLSSIRVRPQRDRDAEGSGLPSSGGYPAGKENQVGGRQFRPLYDIPFMFEAREFLRKRLISKKVTVTIDYVQPKSEEFPEKTCCTVVIGNQNVAEALVGKGLASVVRYRQDDENRSGHYDQLLMAEAKAIKAKKGLHGLAAGTLQADKVPVVRVQELSGDATKSKQFLPYLQRAGRSEAICEFVSSGSRLRLFVPKETCLLTFLLSGINCPRAPRPALPNLPPMDAEPFGEEAAKFTRNLCLQHEVEIEVETMDRAGNIVGYLFVEDGKKNLAEMLVEAGLASVHFTAERSKYYTALKNAEEGAKKRGDKIWANYEEQQAREEAELQAQQVQDRSVKYRNVVVTEVHPNLRVSVQFVEEAPRLEQLNRELKEALAENPPLKGAYTPRKGELCTAEFTVDNQWYRAKIESVKGAQVEVLFVDFGNREMTDSSRLAALPSQFHAVVPGAKDYYLALAKMPPEDQDFGEVALEATRRRLVNRNVWLNVEYRQGNQEFITLVEFPNSPAAAGQQEQQQQQQQEGAGASSTADKPKEEEAAAAEKPLDVGKEIVANGFLLVDERKERRLAALVAEYVSVQEAAKRSHLNVWQYGDFTGVDV